MAVAIMDKAIKIRNWTNYNRI